MFRPIFAALRTLEPLFLQPNRIVSNVLPRKEISLSQAAAFSSHYSPTVFYLNNPAFRSPLIPNSSGLNLKFNAPIIQTSIRPLTKFSLRKGKRKTVKAVISRFYRLDWGIWIRTKAGRQKHLWRKTPERRRRLRQHVFCNATQSTLLDKMVTRFWKKRRYYIDDPYEPYHKREEFSITRKNPI